MDHRGRWLPSSPFATSTSGISQSRNATPPFSLVAASIGLTGPGHGPMRDTGWSVLLLVEHDPPGLFVVSPPTSLSVVTFLAFSTRALDAAFSHLFTQNHRSLTICHDSEVFPPLHDIKTMIPGSNSVRAPWQIPQPVIVVDWVSSYEVVFQRHCRTPKWYSYPFTISRPR